jgi:hypothetical protein
MILLKSSFLLLFAGALPLASLSGCSNGNAPAEPSTPSTTGSAPTPSPSPAVVTPPTATQPATAATPSTGLPQLVFFMNPNGAPCQAQDKILQGMATEFEGKVQLVYRRVTTPEDRDAFTKAGIRGLPSLVLYDASGKEITRTTPGIQDADHVRTLVASH